MANNWGRNYNSNRNTNYYQHSYTNYPHVDGNRGCENWPNYSFPDNPEGVTNSFPQAQMPIAISNDSGMYSGGDYISGADHTQSPLYNVEINSEILARAANSQLTPTAGEFIPSSTYHSTYTPYSSSETYNGHSNHTQRGYNGGSSSRTQGTSDSRVNDIQDTNQHKRNFEKGKTRNFESRRQLTIEQSKAEGRMKLLQEAAGITVPKNDGASTSKGSNSTNEYSKRRHGGIGEKSFQNTSRNTDRNNYLRSNKSQEYYQSKKNSPPRKSQSGSSPYKEKNHFNNKKGVDDAASQRDRLTDQLNRGALECLVCCEPVRPIDSTWSCPKCYHVLHLNCIITWANKSKSENGWRCPACQNVSTSMPKDYYCFCGKTVSPEWNPSDIAHSCGETCNRRKVLASEHYSCIHKCTLLCHPGPCPPCSALVTRKCGCGQSSQTVQCGQLQPLLCGATCGKPLACGIHMCPDQCHFGQCQPCQITIKQVCYCGKNEREVNCDGSICEGEKFICEAPCEGKLLCGQHKCNQTCHEGPCGSCPWDPAEVTHCYCSKTPLTVDQQRTSCLDPIPTCSLVCTKQLSCGQPSNPHHCKAPCHAGSCPPCELFTLVRCRCGFMDKEIPCIELTSKADDARCQKKCTKKRMCGKHKCNQMCCIDVDHLCPLPCNHMLSCGRHRCELLCHRGHCQPCLQSSFEELFCECGSSVMLPPVPCGTKPPQCNKPCSRRHDCDHEVLHSCHSYNQCPPCGILTSKYCHGKHELRKAIPCHLEAFSCGRPCGQNLLCGRHKCNTLCHTGSCPVTCKQPCTKPRDLCGHACNSACHDGECPETPCKEKVLVTCECGHRSTSKPCYENNSEYQRIATSLLASKMADVQLGRSVNLEDMQGSRKITIKTLECTEDCRIVERNRRIAIGLQIRNPDLSSKLTPRYSDFMRAWAKKDQRFCQNVHDKLTELVKLAKESKQKSRSYSFETMNREKRQFVHEYCTHFGCESVAYDAEPKRNVVATAQRDKAWLPSYSLLEVVQREMGLRKVPLPNLHMTSQKPISKSNVLPVKVAQPRSVPDTDPEIAHIDYFDYNG